MPGVLAAATSADMASSAAMMRTGTCFMPISRCMWIVPAAGRQHPCVGGARWAAGQRPALPAMKKGGFAAALQEPAD
ncbi:hypothetical protein G6F31_021923 [Rhizopus arrhizus]|nr:hypothetical protein G6F31_021923 [Rhizopus arrhizus]